MLTLFDTEKFEKQNYTNTKMNFIQKQNNNNKLKMLVYKMNCKHIITVQL